MGEEAEIDVVERQFGHSFINWKISNFCFETTREEFPISTPEFSVDGLHFTKWKLTLNPKMKVGDECAFFIILERTGSDSTPEIVFVDLKLLLMDCEGKYCETLRYKNKFEKSSRHDIPLWSTGYIRGKFDAETYKCQTFGISCHLIVNFEDSYKAFEGPIDTGMKTLSENLMQLFKTGAYHDVILRINGKDISAHKAVLYHRSNVLADAIKGECMVVDLPYLDFETMQDIVAYFYSGNINIIAKSPSILMYDCATLLNIPEVQQFYNPQCLEIQSVIDVREHTFVWAIKNFRQLRETSISSPLLTSECMNTVFRIFLYTEDIMPGQTTHMSIFADVVEGSLPKYSCVKFSITDGDIDLWSKKMQLSTINDKRFGFEKVMTKNHFETLLKTISGDTVNIALSIEIHNDDVSSSEKYAISYSALPVTKYYDCLSVYTTLIFTKGLFTDVAVEAGDSLFRANKCILSARSSAFCSMLEQVKDDKLTIPNIKSHIFHAVLNYIYSGMYEKFKPEDVFDVYKAAERFTLQCLKEKCLDILKKNFNVRSVCEALVFSVEEHDMALKVSALNFIRENKNQFFEDSHWKSLTDVEPSLCTDIMAFIKDRKDFKEV